MRPGIHYDENALIGAMGPSVWAKLGPERWFTRYKIVCANGRGLSAPYVVDMGVTEQGVDYLSTPALLALSQFVNLANGLLAKYRFVLYKPVRIPEGLAASRFIMNDSEYGRYENKRIFRELFSSKIAIPEYQVTPLAALLEASAADAYERYAAALGGQLVVQDELNGGGRGTHMVRSAADMRHAQELLREGCKGEYVVISRHVTGVERSMQACVTASGVVAGPLQQQLVRNPELLNPDQRGGMYFCGGRLGAPTPPAVQEQIRQAMDVIGRDLRQAGYRGIFGADFLVDAAGKVYALEINARTTGLLPLLNEQQCAVPLYLLHILELAGEPYGITAGAKEGAVTHGGPQSFVVLFNKGQELACFDSEITTGNYRFGNGKLQKIDGSPRWTPGADVMLQLFCAPDFRAKPNLKLCNIFLKGQGFGDDGALQQDAREVVAALQAHITAG